MPGNSARKGARRNTANKKGPQVGSGGQRRKQLEGRKPTPRAEERTGHPAKRRAEAAAARRSDTRVRRRKPAGAPEMLVGRNPVLEALRVGVPTTALYLAEHAELDERVRESIRLAGDHGIPIMEVSRNEFDRMTDGALHQGIGIAVPAYDYKHPDDLLEIAAAANEAALVVALDGVQDPRNLGAVVRSAAAFGAHGVIVPERRAAGMTATAWRTSAGAAARLPVAQVTNLSRSVLELQKSGVFVVGLDADADATIEDFDGYADPLCIVVGSEGKGLSRLVAEKCDLTVSIPMSGQTESLNASVAAAVTLWQVSSHRRASAVAGPSDAI